MIADLTFGTETIPKVDKIFWTLNQYVTTAKQLALNYNVLSIFQLVQVRFW